MIELRWVIRTLERWSDKRCDYVELKALPVLQYRDKSDPAAEWFDVPTFEEEA